MLGGVLKVQKDLNFKHNWQKEGVELNEYLSFPSIVKLTKCEFFRVWKDLALELSRRKRNQLEVVLTLWTRP